ncbi:MAG: hypothetical protein IMZ70_03590 [Candidatus Atribacteria bacterium]|nr:hypothetical protein [Candidatus Atribacteria bacterium]
MARKIIKIDEISYICEKCNNEMLKFLVREKGLFTADDPFMFKKYLNTEDTNGPYYKCQFCGTIHKGYYTNDGQNIDFRPLIRK